MDKIITYLIVSISLIVLSVFIASLSVRLILIWFLTTPVIVTCFAYIIYYIVKAITKKELLIIVPTVCFVVTIVSLIIGIILYKNDHSFVMQGLEAELIWFLGTIPSFIATIIHITIFYTKVKSARL